jgi:hypothetical protein
MLRNSPRVKYTGVKADIWKAMGKPKNNVSKNNNQLILYKEFSRPFNSH